MVTSTAPPTLIQTLTSRFHATRYVALAISLVGAVLGWYAFCLISNKTGVYAVDTPQALGLGIALLLAVGWWLRQCFVIPTPA